MYHNQNDMLLTKPESTTSSQSHFSIEHLSLDLKRLSVRGGAVTFTSQGIKFLLQLGSTACLARLLTPQDFGLIAMVTAVTGFIMVFKDLGLSTATIQCSSINHNQVSTLFWINIAVSIVLALITIAVAPAIAWFYKEPRLFWLTVALAGAFIFSGLTVQHQALLKRQMRLSVLALIDIISLVAGILTAVICAFAGMGFWSLVLMQIATAVATAAGVWLASGWRPGWPARRSGIRPLLAFGGYLTGFSIVNYFARNFDNILIGRYCGALPLGLYSRSYSMLLFPIGQIVAPMTSVAVPALSRLQNEPQRYRSYYLKAIKLIAYLTMPLIVILGVLSTEVITLILGNQWIGAAPIFRILAVTAFFQPVGSTMGWIYVSLGKGRRYTIWGILSSSLIVTSFLIGLPWGAIGVATSYAVCTLLLTHPLYAFALAQSPLTPSDVYRCIFRPLCTSCLIGIGMVTARILFPDWNAIWIVLHSLIGAAVVGAGVLLIWPAVRKDLREMATIGALLTKKTTQINEEQLSDNVR